jgi:Leucine-rich repeat (LRR) protein
MGTKVTAAGLKELAAFKNLTELNLSNTGLVPDDLTALAPFTGLTSLYLGNADVTDRTLAVLRQIDLLHALKQAETGKGRRPTGPADVTSVNLLSTRVTSAGLKELAAFKNLTFLALGDHAAGVGGLAAEGLKDLAAFKHLETIQLIHSRITDRVVVALRESNLLHTLDLASASGGKRPLTPKDVVAVRLGGTGITAEGLKEFAAFESLTELGLGSYSITDRALAVLREANLLHALHQATGVGNKRPAKPADVTQTRVTDAGLKELAALPNLTALDLSGCAVAGPGLRDLARVPNLSALNLSRTPLTDATLKDLAGCAKLASLNLDNTKVTDDGLKGLAPLKSLTAISVRGTRVTDDGLKGINLDVQPDRRQITDQLLVGLRAAKRLHTLPIAGPTGPKPPARPEDVTIVNLHGTKVTDAGLKELVAFENLTFLLLGSEHTDRGLKELAAFKKLARLDLFGTKVTDAGLKELAGLKNLTELHLHGTRVTPTG